MMQSLVIANRLIKQIYSNKLQMVATFTAPLIILLFFKVFIKSFPESINTDIYVLPIITYILFFFSFIISSINLINEYKNKTIERILVFGCKKINIILGYILGYLFINIIISFILISFSYYIFSLSYNISTILFILLIFILLSVSSINSSILAASLTKNESSFITIIPPVTLIPMFTSGIILDVNKLPKYFKIFSYVSPIYYSNEIIKHIITNTNLDYYLIIKNIIFIIIYIIISFILAYTSLRKNIQNID